MAPGAVLATYRVVAHNGSSASENRIHHDDVAATYGFRGGLVPGVTVYAYMVGPVLEALGEAWVDRGTMAVRFRQPFYEGDDVEVTARSDPEAIEGSEQVKAVKTVDVVAARAGDPCAIGKATLPGTSPPPPDPADYPEVPTPNRDERPPATAGVLAGLRGLSVPPATFRADRASAYLDEVSSDQPLFRSGGVAHPGYLIRWANTALAANVALGPWIHTASEITNFGRVVDGDRISARARVVDLFERKGHKLVTLDVAVLANEAFSVRIFHTAIYDLAPRDPS